MPTHVILGFAFGLLSAVFFAGYIIPQKILRVDLTTYLGMVAIGVFVVALAAWAVAGFPHHATPVHIGYALLCGAGWSLGTLSFTAGVQRLGMAIATPIKNTTAILGTLVGLILLGEWATTNPWYCTLGSMAIVAAALVIGRANPAHDRIQAPVAGVIFSLMAACFYASYLVPMKLAVTEIGIWEFTPWMAVGILIMALIAILVRPGGLRDFRSYPARYYGISMLGGVSWVIAFITMSMSMLLVDLSVAWSLGNLNTVPAVFIGITIFHEFRFRDHKALIIWGLVLAVVGTLLLGMAKG